MFENIELSPNEYFEKVQELKNDGFEMMVDLTAIDWFRKKEPRFEIVVNFLSVSENKRVCLVVKVNDDLNVPSITSLYPSANFYEREVFDMFGINFEDHPDLTRILMPDDWIGYPLLKDYKMEQAKLPYRPSREDYESWKTKL